MPDILDFIPLFPEESEAAIRARWNAWANEGVDQNTQPDEWVDLREGSFFYLATIPGVREAARWYDKAGTEVISAAFPGFSFGVYADYHADTYSLVRLASTAAEGAVRFNGTNGTIIAAGVRVAAAATAAADDPPSFEVLVGGTIAGGVVEVPVRAVRTGTAGNVAAGAVTVQETPTVGVTSITNDAPITGGTAPETDEALIDRILARFRDPGSWNAVTYEANARSQSGVGRATVIPEGAGPGTVIIILMTANGQAVAQSVVDAYQNAIDPPKYQNQLSGIHNLPQAVITVDATAGARDAGYIRVGTNLVSYTGRTATTFTGAAGGAGAVASGTKVYQGGRGGGRAPIGHHVIVRTATATAVDVAINVELDVGYSLDGANGTINLTTLLRAAVADYIATVQPGEEVVRAKIMQAALSVQGVHDAAFPTINTLAANLTMGTNPAQAPFLNVFTPAAVAL